MDIDPAVLRRARLRAGLSLAQVAGTEISRQAVHQIETGQSRPTWRSLSLIAARLRIPLWQLLRPGSRPAGDGRRRALEALCHDGRYGEVIDEAEALLDSADLRSRATAHLYLGRALLARQRLEDALHHLREARHLFGALPEDPLGAEAAGWEDYAAYLVEQASPA